MEFKFYALYYKQMKPLEAGLEESIVLQKRPHVEKPCIIAKYIVLIFLNPSTDIYFTFHRGRDNFHTNLDITDYRYSRASHVLNDYFIGGVSSLTRMQAKYRFDFCTRVLFIM